MACIIVLKLVYSVSHVLLTPQYYGSSLKKNLSFSFILPILAIQRFYNPHDKTSSVLNHSLCRLRALDFFSLRFRDVQFYQKGHAAVENVSILTYSKNSVSGKLVNLRSVACRRTSCPTNIFLESVLEFMVRSWISSRIS